jgi:hypothetical protein
MPTKQRKKEESNKMATFTVLVNHVKDVTQVFDDAVDAFNTQDKKQVLQGLLDRTVTLFSVDQQNAYVGIQAVMSYLTNNQFPIKPHFNPTTVQVTESQNGKVAHIVGTAIWHDHDKDTDHPIRYAFNFLYKADGQGNVRWLISTLWGSSDA